MTQSRQRKKNTRGPDRLRRRRRERSKIKAVEGVEACSCGCGGYGVPADQLARTFEELWTPEDREWAVRSADAEARGDAAAALEAYVKTLGLSGDLWPAQLDYLARAGDDTPEWLIARWVRAQAVRWMLVNEDPRVQSSIAEALVTHELPAEITPEWVQGYAPMVGASDLLCHDLMLHGEEGLADFIDLRASDELLARAGRVQEWPNLPMGVYEYIDVDRDVLTVRDLATDDLCELLHIGAVTGVDRDATVFGRIVPIETPPGAMFEHRPIDVDPRTAAQLLGDVDQDGEFDDADDFGEFRDSVGSDGNTGREFLAVFAAAAEAGRMPWRPGTRVRTLLWSDALIVDERFEELVATEPESLSPSEPAPWVRDRMAEGVPREIAEGLATCHMALHFVERFPDAMPVTATHAATNLSEPAILEAARQHLTAPEHADAWRTLADYVQEPLRSRCRELATVAAGKAARSTPT